MLARIERYARVIRDIGIVLGLPILLVYIVRLYGLQLDAKQEQLETLKLYSYDRVHETMESMKAVYEKERWLVEQQMTDAHAEQLDSLQAIVDHLRHKEAALKSIYDEYTITTDITEIGWWGADPRGVNRIRGKYYFSPADTASTPKPD